MCLSSMMESPLGICPIVVELDLDIYLFPNSRETTILISRVIYKFSLPAAVDEYYPCSIFSPEWSILCFLDLIHSDWYKMKYQSNFICISLWTKTAEHYFKGSSALFFFENILFRFIPMFIGLFYLFSS